MLYVNVYLVTQIYGGREEGGWYFDSGEPLGSIPIETIKAHQDYYLTSETSGYGRNAKVEKIHIHLRECDACKGTGQVETEDDLDSSDPPQTYMACCEDCGEIPADLEGTSELMKKMYDMFANDAGRHEHIQVMLQPQFAASFPERTPRYE